MRFASQELKATRWEKKLYTDGKKLYTVPTQSAAIVDFGFAKQTGQPLVTTAVAR